MDIVSQEKRSQMMASIRGKNTLPEITLRKYLFKMGFRFRIHVKDLPGHPDIVLPKYNAVIFVHGCFWHQHEGCKNVKVPKSRTDFWTKKFRQNKVRDDKNIQDLETAGWRVLVVWECEISKPNLSKIEEIVDWIKAKEE